MSIYYWLLCFTKKKNISTCQQLIKSMSISLFDFVYGKKERQFEYEK